MDRKVDVSRAVSAMTESALAPEKLWRNRATTRALVGTAAVVLPLLSANTRGDVISAGTVSTGQTQDVTLGTTAIDTNILGTQNVDSGGVTSRVMVSSGGSQNVNNGGISISAVINSSGLQNIGSGGFASATVISAGTQNVNSGGTAFITRISRGVQNVNGSAIATTLLSNGTQNVGAGGFASGVSIASGAIQNVSAGRSAVSASVNGGEQNVGSGGTVSGGSFTAHGIQVVGSGGTAIGDTFVSGVQIIEAGASVSNTRLSGGATQALTSGASVFATILTGNTFQNVVSGATAVQTQVGNVFDFFSSRNIQNVNSGGTAIGTVVNSGSQTVAAGASVSDTTITGSAGHQLISSGATVVRTRLFNGSILNVTNGATAIQTQVGEPAASSIYPPSVQNVSGGGSAISTVINANGSQAVLSGAFVSDTTLYGAGTLAETMTFRGGSQSIASGASVIDTHLLAGGIQNVTLGATALHTDINEGSLQNVSSGGTASGTVINPTGTQAVQAGANVFDTTLFGGGSQFIGSGASVTDTHLLSGGIQVVTLGATAIHTDINDGTVQFVSSGGQATSTLVNSGGIQSIYAGAGVSGTTISAGGIAVANETGVSLANLMLSGGTLWLNDPNAGDVKPASFHQVSVNGLSGVGVAGFATDVAGQTGDLLNVQNGQGAFSMAVHDYSTTAADPTFRLLVVTTDSSTATQVSLQGRSVDVGAFQYGLLKDGPNYYLAILRAPDNPATQGSGGGSSIGAGVAQGGDVQNGIGGTDGFLPTNTTQTVVAAAKAVGAIWYSQLQQVQRRLGDLRSSPGDNGVWVRTYGDERRLFNPGVNVTGGGVQAGIDHRYHTDNGDWVAGFTTGVGYDSLDMGSSGTGNTNQWNVGLYGLWLGNAGWYASATAKYNYIDVRLHSVTGEGEPVSAAYNLTGYTVSLEGGKRWLLKNDWFVEPQVEWTMAHGGSASYTTSTNLPVNAEAATAQLVRVGVAFGKKFEKDNGDSVEPYMRVSAVRQFHGDNAVIVAGSPFDVTTRSTYAVMSVGTTAKFKNLHFFAEVGYARGTGYEMPWSVNAGLRYNW